MVVGLAQDEVDPDLLFGLPHPVSEEVGLTVPVVVHLGPLSAVTREPVNESNDVLAFFRPCFDF